MTEYSCEQQLRRALDRCAELEQERDALFEQRISGRPESVKGWLREHREYLIDPRKIDMLHEARFQVLCDTNDIDMSAPEYLEALETHLGIR